jgi:hypothetical protein
MYAIRTIEWISLAAILIGPLLAVLATRYLDDRKAKHEQRMSVFKTLMRTRRTPTTPEHVGALNLVEIEFRNDGDVIGAWRALFSHFGTEHAPRTHERQDASLSDDENRHRQTQFTNRIVTERQTLLAKLLHCMAKALGFRIEQLEIFEGGYTPQLWWDDELEGRVARRLFADIAIGKRSLPIAVTDYTQARTEPEQPPPT